MVQKIPSAFMDISLWAATTGPPLSGAICAPPAPPHRLSGTALLTCRQMPHSCIGMTAEKLEQALEKTIRGHANGVTFHPSSLRRTLCTPHFSGFARLASHRFSTACNKPAFSTG